MQHKSQVTVKQIAEMLSLSPATVSKALNWYPDIKEHTRMQVIECARKLGYSTRMKTRQPPEEKPMRLGVLVSDFAQDPDASPFLYDILMGFRKYADKQNYEVHFLSTSPEDQELIPYDRLVAEKDLTGIFLTGLSTKDIYYTQLKTTSVPTVAFDLRVDNPMVGSVSASSAEGTMLAMNHLTELGHRRIGFLNGHRYAAVSAERLSGYITGLIAHGIEYRPELVYEGDFTSASGAAAAGYFADKGVTALFCASDIMAIGAMKQFQKLGRDVPRDISIVGYDNISYSLDTDPPLTTVNQDKYHLGLASAALLECIIRKFPFKNVVLSPQLIVRESTAPIPGGPETRPLP
jgi:LacI family transcriptional regulator